MHKLYLIVAFILYSVKVESATPCHSKNCLCRYDVKSDSDLFRQYVDCSYNPKVLDEEYSLPNDVYSLNLSRNNLTILKESGLFQSETLAELILSNNILSVIQQNVLRLPELKRLDLSDNKLDFLPKDTFKYIKKLEYLNLGNNKFISFERIAFHNLGNLMEIVLDNNNLGPSLENNLLFDRSGYGLTHKIESLSIRNINLNSVHDNFFVDAYNLRKLIISKNNLTDVFEIPFTLEYLDLSDNPIAEISSEDFADLVALKDLKLNNLWIQEIEDYTFASLRSLISLELERNGNLTKFSATAFGRKVLEDADDFALETLSLKSSKLQTLSEELAVPFGQLLHLDLQGNLWKCDCHLLWVKQLQIQPRDYEHLRCFTPKTLFNSRIFDLNAKYFTCGMKDRHIGIAIAAVSCCLALTAVAFWIYTVPRFGSRSHFISSLHVPTAEYTILPINSNFRE